SERDVVHSPELTGTQLRAARGQAQRIPRDVFQGVAHSPPEAAAKLLTHIFDTDNGFRHRVCIGPLLDPLGDARLGDVKNAPSPQKYHTAYQAANRITTGL